MTPPDPTSPSGENNLRHELAALLNRYCAENGSDTPDYILADYLIACLYAFDTATRTRTTWYGPPSLGSNDNG